MAEPSMRGWWQDGSGKWWPPEKPRPKSAAEQAADVATRGLVGMVVAFVLCLTLAAWVVIDSCMQAEEERPYRECVAWLQAAGASADDAAAYASALQRCIEARR